MSFDSLAFLIKSAFKSIFKNWLLTIASVTVLSVCISTLGVTLLGVDNVNKIVDVIGDESRVVLFLDEELDINTDSEKVGQIENQLRDIKNIKSIHFTSKQESLEEYKDMLGESNWLAGGLTEDIFRASFTFEVEDLSKFDQTMYAVEKIDGIARVRERRDIIQSIERIKNVVLFLAFWVVVFLVVISILVITNSVKVSVYSRRHELNIMKYVGATDAFVQAPYFLEGVITGIVSGIISTIILAVTYSRIIAPIIKDIIGDFEPVAFKDCALFYALGFVVVGGIVGMIGSAFPVKKYLNV